MADIFLSYAREDRKRAASLARALEGLDWSVFWDLNVPAGQTWDKYIGSELEKARCVVVVWSKAAVESDWVSEEAREGREREILVPAFFAKVKPPFGFRGIQGPDLAAWRSSTQAPAFQALVRGIERILGPVPKTQTEQPPTPLPAKKPARKKPVLTQRKALFMLILSDGKSKTIYELAKLADKGTGGKRTGGKLDARGLFVATKEDAGTLTALKQDGLVESFEESPPGWEGRPVRRYRLTVEGLSFAQDVSRIGGPWRRRQK